MTISTRKAARIRKGITDARLSRKPAMSLSLTAFSRAYDREKKTLSMMMLVMPDSIREEYTSLVMSGIFGFANEATMGRIFEIESACRREATTLLRKGGVRNG